MSYRRTNDGGPLEVEPSTAGASGVRDHGKEIPMGVLGQVAYEAYGDVTGWKNYQGLPMPAWTELPPLIRNAWNAAAKAVVDSQ